jgi:hypothetical protein
MHHTDSMCLGTDGAHARRFRSRDLGLERVRRAGTIELQIYKSWGWGWDVGGGPEVQWEMD